MKLTRLVEAVEGWGQIAARVSAHTGIDVSADACRRAASREKDPLPVRRFGVGYRARVVADGVEVDLWADRQWGIGK